VKERKQLEQVLVCVDCGAVSDERAAGLAYQADDDEVAVYCVACWPQEFGESGQASAGRSGSTAAPRVCRRQRSRRAADCSGERHAGCRSLAEAGRPRAYRDVALRFVREVSVCNGALFREGRI
jgi:hypothetical protein